ncbi:hypothetical protein JYU12_01125 [bacterium AH-315-K03]|nr:hypothetical protein [bacterium AH-315-K03]
MNPFDESHLINYLIGLFIDRLLGVIYIGRNSADIHQKGVGKGGVKYLCEAKKLWIEW